MWMDKASGWWALLPLVEIHVQWASRCCPETILGFQAASRRVFEFWRLGFDRVCEGLQFRRKNREVWSFYEEVMSV